MKDETIQYKTDIFGSLFYLANRLETIIDRDFAQYDFTAKQWFLMAVIGRFFDTPPKLIDVSEWMGSSYQNIKQLALKLERIGFVKMERDINDRRAIRLALTEKCKQFFLNHAPEDYNFINKMYQGFEPHDIVNFMNYFNKIINNIKSMQ